jgi:hypothetical protein
MKRFEYKTITVTEEDLTKTLDSFGNSGYDLVTVLSKPEVRPSKVFGQMPMMISNFMLIFKTELNG